MMMKITRRDLILSAASAALVATTAPLARAQAYPTKPITLICPFGAGTTTDIIARLTAHYMSEDLGQQIIVDNRVGAGGTIAAAAAARAAPDGYTLFMGAMSTQAIAMSIYPNLPYDSVRDFTPISLLTNGPNVIVVHKDVPAKTLPELVELAKKTPGGLLYASAGPGTASHLVIEVLKLRTGAPLEHVPYKSGAQAITDVATGRVPMIGYQIPALMPHIEAGNLRVLGTPSLKRIDQLPNVPTAAEQGIADYDVGSWFGLFGPAGLPQPIVDRLYQSSQKMLAMAELKPQLQAQGLEVVGNSPQEFRAFVESEVAKWAVVIKASGAKID